LEGNKVTIEKCWLSVSDRDRQGMNIFLTLSFVITLVTGQAGYICSYPVSTSA
jgi:hypothetical protein